MQGPTEAIIAKKTRGALKAAVRSLHNIPLNTQEKPHCLGNKSQPGSCLAHQGNSNTTTDEQWKVVEETCTWSSHCITDVS